MNKDKIYIKTYANNKNLVQQNIDSINPNWQETTKLLALDSDKGDEFGCSVFIDGDCAIIGAEWDDDNEHSGSAYIFKHNGTTWFQEDKLLSLNGERYDKFGCAVSFDGDYAIIGAYYDEEHGTCSGSAYIFKRNGTTWYQEAKLYSSNCGICDYFGCSVSIDGDYAIIGSLGGGPKGGAAYIFKRNGTTWFEEIKLIPPDQTYADLFGRSVYMDGDYLIVGADGHNDDAGAAYVYKYNGTTWSLQDKLFASDFELGESFGISVSMDGDYAIVGAALDDDNGQKSGSAYIFKRNGSDWIEEDKLLAFDGATTDFFGWSVSIDGDYVIIGAPGEYDGYHIGSAYIFKRNGTTWSQEEKLTASDGESGNDFGSSVSIHEYNAIIGARLDDANTGSAYIFTKNGVNLPPESPHIDGSTSGKPNIDYYFSFNATDPNDDSVMYYIDWGDDNSEWTEYTNSGEEIIIKHNWSEEGTYNIIAKVQDIYGAESPEGTLTVEIPRNRAAYHLMLLRLFERFPNLLPILQQLLRLW